MRFSLNGVRLVGTPTRVIAIGAAALATTASAVMASPPGLGWWTPDRDRGRRSPVTFTWNRPQPAPVIGDVRPANLQFTAYQADDSVILIATGVNSSGGFTTSLCDVHEHGNRVAVTMHNHAPRGFATTCMTPFNIAASFRSRGRLHCITVELGCEQFEVPVIQTARIR